MSEIDVRLNILNTLLTTPHRKVESLFPVHQALISQDPLFYVRLAAWYSDTGDIRDHKEVFAANLCLSNFDGHRDVGLALLRELPPYQVQRVVDFVHGTKKAKKVNPEKPNAAGTEKINTLLKKIIVQGEVESFGLGKPIPRSMKTEVERYLREREADAEWFDSTVLIARSSLKRLYALLHIKPSERADAILFKGKPPEGSRLLAMKTLANAKTPADQARTIIENKIPYRIASTVVSAMTPTVLLALIEVMSPQELINNLNSLKKRGAMDNVDLKAAIDAKLEKAKTSKRVSALKTGEAVKTGMTKDVQEKLEAVADAQIKAKGRLKRPTCLLIDKSGSMQSALEVGKQIGAMISAIADAPLYAYAFDTMPYPIAPAKTDLASWAAAMKGMNASGGTACGSGLEAMIRNKQMVEQIILVSDGGETAQPSFAQSHERYCTAMNVRPSVCLVHVNGDTNILVRNCAVAKIELDVWEFTGDYYSLPGLIPLLTKSSRLDLLLDIMQYPLPTRKMF